MTVPSRRLPLLYCLLLIPFLVAPLSAQDRRFHLSFVGDLMIHTANYLTLEYSSIYESVSWLLRRDDLSFANLEFPIEPARSFSSYPCFNGNLEYLEAAVEAGIDVFSLANNHAFDQGPEGILQTLRALQCAGELSYRRLYEDGIRADLERPFQPVEIRLKGLRIGFLAVCQMVNQSMPFPYVHIVDYRNCAHRNNFLPYIKEVAGRYDLFILSYHGGGEYSRRPEKAKIEFFDRLLEAGVDIVWAHHPHVLQPHKIVEREEGRGLIMYSTGNFISGMPVAIDPAKPEDWLSWTGDSALWLVSLRWAEGRVSVEGVLPIPIVNYRNGRGEVLVATFPGLARGRVSGSWLEYYRERSRLVRGPLRPAASLRTAVSQP